MINDKKRLLKNYMANLQVNVEMAEFTHCSETWRDLNYIPEYSKLYFISEGEGWLKVGDMEYYPKPGELYLMPSGIKQSYATISSNTFKKYWCHFTARVGDKSLFEIFRLPHYINVKDIDYLTGLFKRLSLYLKGNEIQDTIRVKSIMLEIIAYYIENSVVEDILLAETESIKKLNYVINYIENNLSENINVDKLAEMLHFHPNYFIRFFKNHLGSSPIQYIHKRKMETAKNLLYSSDMTITEISESIGYKDIYHFSKSFKAYTGYSPSEFKASLVKLS